MCEAILEVMLRIHAMPTPGRIKFIQRLLVLMVVMLVEVKKLFFLFPLMQQGSGSDVHDIVVLVLMLVILWVLVWVLA